MPRVTKNPIVLLALSPAATATALGIRADEVAAGIASGALPVYVRGLKRRILVSDVEAFVRSWPKPTKRKYKRRAPCPT